MNCPFCKNAFNRVSYYSYCWSCPIPVKLVGGLTDGVIILTVEGEDCNYELDLELETKSVALYGINTDKIVYLNCLPDINPNNAKEWVDKLLKLAVFS